MFKMNYKDVDINVLARMLEMKGLHSYEVSLYYYNYLNNQIL